MPEVGVTPLFSREGLSRASARRFSSREAFIAYRTDKLSLREGSDSFSAKLFLTRDPLSYPSKAAESIEEGMSGSIFSSSCYHMNPINLLYIDSCIHIYIISLYISSCTHVNMNNYSITISCTHVYMTDIHI